MAKSRTLWRWLGGITLLTAVITWGNTLDWWNILFDLKQENLATLNQIAGILSLPATIVIGVYQLRLSRRAAPGAGAQPQHDRAHVAESPPVTVPRREPGIIDRTDEVSVLRERLTGGASGVVIVAGPPGVGKAEVVEEVLWELEKAPADPSGPPRPRIVRREAAPDLDPDLGMGFDVARLVADIEDLSEDDLALYEAIGLDHPPLDQLTAALNDHQGVPVVIAVRHADRLLVPETHRLRDPELDQAFEILANGTGRRVNVILMTRHLPKALGHGTWPEHRRPIVVEGLGPDHFATYVRRLAGDDKPLAKAVARLRRTLRGRPRLAELACAAFRAAPESPAKLAAELKGMGGDDDVLGFLVQHVVAGLKPLEQRVLEALDAYGTPVRLDAVCALVVEEHHEPHPADEVQNALTRLVERHVAVRTAQGEYHLRLSEAERGRAGLPGKDDPVDRKWYDLLRRAGYELHARRVDPPRTLADLRLHLAELRALTRAGDLWDRAYRRVQALDPELRKRNRASLLLATREQLRGRLGSARREMANHNALGDLYASKGDFAAANQSYAKALEHANALRDLPNRTVIRANWAGAYWRHFEVETAYGYYELARDDHDELRRSNPQAHRDLLPLRMNIFEGLADCHRHWGEYADAIRCAQEARAVPESEGYPGTPRARDFTARKSAGIGMKLARWHAELGDREAAERIDETVRREVDGHGHDWLRGVHRSGHAYLLLDRNPGEAIRAAREAEELARGFADPVALLQARTTLCLAYLKENDLDGAARQIEAAMPYRGRGGSLLAPALHALVTAASPGPGPGRGRAGELFLALLAEAEDRIGHDPHDVAAWDVKGFALCGRFLDGEGELRDAIAAFQTARGTSRDPLRVREATPGLVDQWIFLLDRLDRHARPPGLLRPVIDVLAATQARIIGS